MNLKSVSQKTTTPLSGRPENNDAQPNTLVPNWIPENRVLESIGTLAAIFGIALGVSCMVFHVRAGDLYLASSVEGLTALSLYFLFTGIGLCCRLRFAAIALVPGLLLVAASQVMLAWTPSPWPRAVQHLLLACFLAWPLLLLWRHRNEYK